MAKIIQFPGKKKGGEKFNFEKLKIFAKSLNKQALNKLNTWAALKKLTSDSDLANLQEAFEQTLIGESDPSPKFMREFLKIRRYLMAAVIYKAASKGMKSSLYAQNKKSILQKLEALETIADTKDWDWVSFNELEFDFFATLAALSGEQNFVSILNEAKQTYLTSILTLNDKFWNMREAVDFYTKIWNRIESGKAVSARDILLDYYEKNDDKIIFYFKEMQK